MSARAPKIFTQAFVLVSAVAAYVVESAVPAFVLDVVVFHVVLSLMHSFVSRTYRVCTPFEMQGTGSVCEHVVD